jgi:hypothetical protein
MTEEATRNNKNKDYWAELSKKDKILWKNKEAFWRDFASLFTLIGDESCQNLKP